MKIKLNRDLSLDKKHGATKGREFEVIEGDVMKRLLFVIGDAGEKFGVYSNECEEVEE